MIKSIVYVVAGMSLFLVSCTKKPSNQPVEAFCSEMRGSHIKIMGCHWKGRIRVDLSDGRSGDAKPMVVWSIDSDSGEINVFNVPQKKKMLNPIATQRDLLQQEPKEMKLYMERKKQTEDSIVKTTAAEGRSEQNDSYDQNCTWYKMQDPMLKVNNPKQQFDNVCIAKADDKIIQAYMAFVNSIKRVDEKYFPIALDGMPLLNWRLPFHKPDGWIKKGFLPKVFVTGSMLSSQTSMNRMEFKYSFKAMPESDFHYNPVWAQDKK